jgi:hypothetical protein
MCVVDGPGDAGFLAGVHPDRLAAMSQWVDAVDTAGGAVVVGLDEAQGHYDLNSVATRADARGGFVSLLAS